MYLTINSVTSKVVSISGTAMVMGSNITTGSALAISYSNPTFKSFGDLSVIKVFDFMTSAQIASVLAKDYSVDVTAALQNAINATSPGRWLDLPAGGYRIDGTITLASYRYIRGQGMGSTILKKTGTGDMITATGTTQKYYFILQDLTLDINNIGSGIVMEWIQWVFIKRLEILNPGTYGINIATLSGSDTNMRNVELNYIEDCRFYQNGATASTKMIRINNTNTIVIRNCYLQNNSTGQGIYLQNTGQIVVQNCTFSTCAIGLAYTLGCNNLRVDCCNFDGAASAIRGAYTASPNNSNSFVYGLIITNCHFTGATNTNPSVVLGAVCGAQISGCTWDLNANECINICNGQGGVNVASSNIAITDCLFKDNNTSAIGANGACIKCETTAMNYLSVVGCYFYDTQGTPTQTIPMVFKSAMHDNIVIDSCSLQSYSSNPSISTIYPGTFGSNVKVINCWNVNSLPGSIKVPKNNQTSASALPTSGNWEVGMVIWNTAPTSGGYIGWTCTSSGTSGTYSEGLTATANGTTSVTLSGSSTVISAGMYLTINGVTSKVASISGTAMTMVDNITTGSSLAITFSNPTFKTFGLIS